MLNECAAIYVGGRFGEISELYVVPDARSENVGALLTDAAAAFGRERNWPFIEVGAPSVPAWQRTVDFYLKHGFEEIGPACISSSIARNSAEPEQPTRQKRVHRARGTIFGSNRCAMEVAAQTGEAPSKDRRGLGVLMGGW